MNIDILLNLRKDPRHQSKIKLLNFRYVLSKKFAEKELSTTEIIELGFVDKESRVKVFEKECPAINHIMVYDVRLADEANEDYVYSISPDLQYNLRKGLTIAEVYDPDNFEIK